MNLFKSTYSKLHASRIIIHNSNLGFAPLLVVVAVAIMAAAVPTTVILVQQEQDNRQEATNSCFPRCIARQGQVCIDGNCLVTSGRECKTTGMSGNDACVSGVCVNGFCKDTHSKLGEKCDAKEDADCDQSTSKLTCHFGICFRLQEYQESCERPENCCSNVCTNGKCAGAASACANLTPSPTTRPTATSTPSPTRSPGGVITTPGSTQIQARGSLGITVIANDTDYTLIRARIWLNENSPALEEFRAVKNSSSAYRWDIPNRVWSNLNSYQVHIELFDDSRVIYAKTLESFSVTSSPIILQYTIDLNDDPDEDPTLTPTPRNTGGQERTIEPTPTPRPIEWCRTDGNQGQGQGCCSNASCQEGLSCTGKPEPGGLRCCPANTFWDGEKCAGATCQSFGFSCVSGSNKAGEVCCSPQFTCSNSVCIESEDYTKLPTPTPNQTITPTPPANPCDNFGGQNGCTAWCRTTGGGGPDSYCNTSCGTDGTGCIKPLTGTPIPTVADNCAVFGGQAACNAWCQKPERGAAGCNTGCNGCYY